MSIDYKKRVIQPAWELVRERKKIKKLNIVWGFLSVVFLTVILAYQTIYTYVVIFSKEDKALELILEFFESKYLTEVLSIWWIFLLFYIILVPILDWALIKHIDSINRKEENSIGDSVGFGTLKFFAIFEYNNLFNVFKFMSVLNWFLFLIRFLWIEYIQVLSYVFIIIFFLASIINVFLSYAKYEIILNNKKAFESIGSSAKIVLLNLWLTIRIYSLMFILNMRVLFNFVIFLAFPIAIASAITYLTTQIYMTIAVLILSVIFLWFIILLSHMASVLEIFKVSTWYFAYLEARKKLEDVEENNTESS